MVAVVALDFVVAKVGVETARNVAATLVTSGSDLVAGSIEKVDPMQLVAAYLQPQQERLRTYLVPLRGVRGLLCWHDPALTTWLCLAPGIRGGVHGDDNGGAPCHVCSDG